MSALLPYLRNPNANVAGLNPEFAGNLERFLKDNPYGAGITSGYRSVEQQQKLWDDALVKYGSPEAARKWVAPPGSSKHNHGSAVDIAWGSDASSKQKAIEWGHANAKNYGLHFPLSNENWHVEPIGSRDSKTGGVHTANDGHNHGPAPAGINPNTGQPTGGAPAAQPGGAFAGMQAPAGLQEGQVVQMGEQSPKGIIPKLIALINGENPFEKQGGVFRVVRGPGAFGGMGQG